MNDRVWNEQRNKLLLMMIDAGDTRRKIAEYFGTSLQAIEVQLSRLKKAGHGVELPKYYYKTSKPQPEEQPKREAVLVSPVHYMNVRPKQCRHFVTPALMCGKPAKGERCGEHRK